MSWLCLSGGEIIRSFLFFFWVHTLVDDGCKLSSSLRRRDGHFESLSKTHSGVVVLVRPLYRQNNIVNICALSHEQLFFWLSRAGISGERIRQPEDESEFVRSFGLDLLQLEEILYYHQLHEWIKWSTYQRFTPFRRLLIAILGRFQEWGSSSRSPSCLSTYP